MAIDQTLLERAMSGERWLRLYGWEPPCLSFGRHEPATRRYDKARIVSLGLDVVRRPTGGRAVWHAREMTYTVASPGNLGSLREGYLEIHRMLRDALRRLGAAAELAPTGAPAPVGAGACFAHPVGGEVMVRGRKVIGSAQLRRGDAILQHGSILIDDDQATVGAVTRGAAPPALAAPLRSVIGGSVQREDLIEAVAGAAEDRWRGVWHREESPDGVVADAAHHAALFRSAEWTWRGVSQR
jgi:lipoyl(octanoyl) transferase